VKPLFSFVVPKNVYMKIIRPTTATNSIVVYLKSYCWVTHASPLINV